jgi:hypothetical protein
VTAAPALAAVPRTRGAQRRFGQRFVRYTRPPRRAVVDAADGYDDRFLWIQAEDPLLLHDATIARVRGTGQVFRVERMIYPTIAYVLSAGSRAALPWSMLATNVAVVLLLTAGLALFLGSEGFAPAWAIVIGLLPGIVIATVRDLSDPTASRRSSPGRSTLTRAPARTRLRPPRHRSCRR